MQVLTTLLGMATVGYFLSIGLLIDQNLRPMVRYMYLPYVVLLVITGIRSLFLLNHSRVQRGNMQSLSMAVVFLIRLSFLMTSITFSLKLGGSLPNWSWTETLCPLGILIIILLGVGLMALVGLFISVCDMDNWRSRIGRGQIGLAIAVLVLSVGLATFVLIGIRTLAPQSLISPSEHLRLIQGFLLYLSVYFLATLALWLISKRNMQ